MFRRSYVVLLEILIAMTLVAILLTVLMGFWGEVAWLDQEGQKAEKESFEALYVQFRFGHVFSRVIPPFESEGIKIPEPKQNEASNEPVEPPKPPQVDDDYYFFTSPSPSGVGRALVFSYDNDTGAGPLFSNDVIGKLFIDKGGNLVLVTWPPPSRVESLNPPMMKEILMEGVEDLDFKFFRPAALGQDGSPSSTPGQWTSSWDLTDYELPAIIKILVRKKGSQTPLTYAYVMPNTIIPVYYR